MTYPEAHSDATGFIHAFTQALLRNGMERVDSAKSANIIFAFNHPRYCSEHYRDLVKSQALKVLFQFEPQAVNPILYKSKTLGQYHHSLKIGGWKHFGVPEKVIRWPYVTFANPARPTATEIRDAATAFYAFDEHATTRSIEVSMIASNKASWAKESNYRLRRQVVEESQALGVQVFGMGWSESRFLRFYKNFRLFLFFISQAHFPNPIHLVDNALSRPRNDIPSIVDKRDVLLQSKFHLIIENSSSYVSEKILDSFIYGAVPIYIGPRLEQFGIPQNCFIQADASLEGIHKSLDGLSTLNLSAYRTHIREFLDSDDGFRLWNQESVSESILDLYL